MQWMDPQTEPPSQRAVVLLVDDEVLLRMLGVDLLEEAGFAVIEASNADEALAALHARPEVRVLFTDVDMPGSMDGFELARVTREHWPEVAVLVVSGKTTPGPDDLPPGGRFIAKPYQPERLIRLVREMARTPA
jgi:CheY-like chemotaxis protein